MADVQNFKKGKAVLPHGLTVPSSPGRLADGVSPPVEPAIPPMLTVAPVGQFVLSTIGGTLTLQAMDIASVTGGIPELIETPIVGRTTGTSLGDVGRRTVTLKCGAFGRLDGSDVTSIVRAVAQVAVLGRVVRLYGPLDRVGVQGALWVMGDPAPEDVAMRASGRFSHAVWSLTLGEWSPLDAIETDDGQSSSKRVRMRLRADQGGGRVKPRTKIAGFSDLGSFN